MISHGPTDQITDIPGCEIRGYHLFTYTTWFNQFWENHAGLSSLWSGLLPFFYSNHLHISIKVAIIHLQLGMVIIVLPTLVGWSDSDKYQEPIQYALQWMLRGIHITQIWHGKKHWAYKNHEISPKIKISIFSFHSYIKRYSFLL